MEFLDLKTLSLIALLTSIMLPLVLLSAVNAKHDDPVMMDWSRGATLYSVGFIGLSLRGLLPDFISIVVANLLVISGYFELHRGIRRFYQRHTSRRLLFIVGPVVGLIFVWFGLIDPSLTIRLIAFSGIVFALTAAISMFDCPEHNHTSPINTSSHVTVFAPLTTNLTGPPDFCAGNATFHSPFAFGVAATLVSPTCTVTVSPAAAQPQTWIGFPCCKTM